MNTDKILEKAIQQVNLSVTEGKKLYEYVSTSELMFVANEIRNKKVSPNYVSWMIDRNVNITNVCISACAFCNFFCSSKSEKAYITSISQYIDKINEMRNIGGNQLLLQGGLHPELGIEYYVGLFRELKKRYSELKLNALGPPEIVHLRKLSGLQIEEVLGKLRDAGLDTLPGAGAEILSDRVRKIISPNKCNTFEWLHVMETAHQMKIATSATMMFGHIETVEERIIHLILLRDLQQKKPMDAKGFVSFIPWPFQDKNTSLKKNKISTIQYISQEEYIRTIAISRILLNNIDHIQASWLTVGKETAQICLHAGADDFGSIMIEENVVSSAGATHAFNVEGIQKAIRDAGFSPRRRTQEYQYID